MKKYIMKVKKYLIAQIAIDALLIIILSFLPVIQRNLFDTIEQKHELNIGYYIFLYMLSLIVIAALSYFGYLITSRGSIEFRRILKKDLFRAMTFYSNKKFIEKSVPEYISIFNNDIASIDDDYLSGIVSIIKAVNMIIIYSITIILFFDWRIAVLLSVISVISITIFPRFTSKKLAEEKYEELKKTELYTLKFTDLLQGIRLFNNRTRKHLELEHDKKLREMADIEYKYGRTRTIAIIINGGSTYLINFFSVVLAAYLCIKGKITIGAAVASLGYIYSYIAPMQMLMKAINGLNASKDVRAKLENLLDSEKGTTHCERVKELKSNIEIKNMNINFDEFEVKDFSFKFEKGKKYALIGSSGSGKSTVLKSLAGINKIESGNIYIDGLDISKIDTSDVLAYLDQNEYIFSDGFENNITVYNSYSMIGIDRIKNSIDKCIYNTIAKSKNCNKLSGGEKKIVAIFRKLIQEPSILLLDEPFTGVDKKLAKTLMNELLKLEDKTIIMITHDIKEELEKFEEIILMEDGQVIKNGEFSAISETSEYNSLANAEIATTE
ncbi:ABC transporter ATP-binding protein [Clostridium sp. KNHs214]|uniref:ATP-binding cassette domain-containing protein n=1 Tax=Clostridium sp. KNHs214 TaxID=1540257 RepID=UPI00055720CA|nr:ABC transporter ATP-binding protein [Clostridium sp. KNHs214]